MVESKNKTKKKVKKMPSYYQPQVKNEVIKEGWITRFTCGEDLPYVIKA